MLYGHVVVADWPVGASIFGPLRHFLPRDCRLKKQAPVQIHRNRRSPSPDMWGPTVPIQLVDLIWFFPLPFKFLLQINLGSSWQVLEKWEMIVHVIVVLQSRE